AMNGKIVPGEGETLQKKVPSKFFIAWNLFIYYFWLVMSQPLFYLLIQDFSLSSSSAQRLANFRCLLA
ncbi:hypothetical protein, partial [Lederbergia ruris]|uniref:hypothetical protein n=1 Tax=Lederbergia ruris TaxID=217495 RepID=UPI001BB31783